jgi:predicted AAA+ superfamily ATPase
VTLKTVYDRTDRIFILVTGSSSISLMTNADTVRRARFEKLYPLSFVEYHLLKDAAYPVKNLSETLRSSLYSSSDCVAAFKLVKRAAADSLEYMTKLPSYSVEEYLRVGTLPASIQYSDENVFFEMVSNTLDKVISNDIELMAKFSSETQKKILRLVSVLALSERTNIDSLCGDIGISKPTMIEAIDLLEKSELIYPVRPIASAKAKILKSPKYRFLAASIRASLLSRIGVDISDPKWYGVLLEDAVAMYLYKSRELRLIRDFNFDPIEGGADFIVARNDGSRIVIEVGYGRKDTGMRQISVTRERAKPKYSILISDKGPDLNKDESIIFIPKELFLLS